MPNVEFSNLVVSRESVSEILDTSFKEFGQETVDSQKSVEQFFQDYSDLYYQIPAEGLVNSHEYLVSMSSQLLQVESTMLDIQPLLDEITALKSQAVSYQETIVELNTRIAELSATNN